MPRRDQVSLRLAHGAEVFAFETDPFVAAQHRRLQPDLAIAVAHLGRHLGDLEAAGLAGTHPAAQQAEGLGEERLRTDRGAPAPSRSAARTADARSAAGS